MNLYLDCVHLLLLPSAFMAEEEIFTFTCINAKVDALEWICEQCGTFSRWSIMLLLLLVKSAELALCFSKPFQMELKVFSCYKIQRLNESGLFIFYSSCKCTCSISSFWAVLLWKEIKMFFKSLDFHHQPSQTNNVIFFNKSMSSRRFIVITVSPLHHYPNFQKIAQGWKN